MSDRFYTTGGTLSQNAPSYVERQADRALLDGLERGEYCYILTSRQMGKSSLMIRTASRLRGEDECDVAVLDLAAVGQNLNPEQWYDGMLLRLGRQLGVEDEFDDFWLDNPRLGPVQRFFEALYQVVLVKRQRRLILFVDELDTVRSLPFSSDEFFAAIRQCFNERSQDPVWKQLSFCLLGVATPSDLIKDPHISPFNIGRRIVLEDFKKDEVAKLVAGLEADDRGEILLERIFGWTNGHPYLTQRLCRAVAEQNRSEDAASVLQPGTVDGICHRLFLSNRAKERDDNLIFVRERLLRSDHDRAAVLDLYRKVRSGTPVVDDETNPLIGTLHLSGVTQIDKGKLRVRNRIYRHVFSPAWIRATMPDAEKRRQKEAYRRGVIRTTALATVVVVLMVYLAGMAYIQSQRAQARLIAQNTDNGSRLLAEGDNYDALAWFAENLKLTKEGSVDEVLGRQQFAAVLRHSPRLVEVLPHDSAVRHLGFSPDGRYLVTSSDDQAARVWDLSTGTLKFPPLSHGSSVVYSEFSPDGARLVTASSDQSARVFDMGTGAMIGVAMHHDYEVVQAIFSPDGANVATASFDDTARLWSADSGLPVSEPLKHRYAVNQIAFSPDGKYLVSASKDGTAQVWSTDAGTATPYRVLEHDDPVNAAKFSPDGRFVATGSDDGNLRLWSLESGEVDFTLSHPAAVKSLNFSPSGTVLATGGLDGLVRIVDLETRQMQALPLLHRDQLVRVVFSPAGDLLLSVTAGNEARVWDVASGRPVSPPFRHLDHIYDASFDETGRRVATAGADNLAKIWDLAGVSARASEWTETSEVRAVAYSPNGEFVAYGLRNGKVAVRNANSGAERFTGGLQHGGEVVFLTFAPDSNTLLSTGFGGKARLWDMESGEQRHEFHHEDSINFACFNGMGNRLITTSRDRKAIVWNVQTGKASIPPVEHDYSVVNAGFTTGGREFVTASADNSVYVWSTLSGKRVRGPFRTGYSLGKPAMDKSGERFVALSAESVARVYSLADGRPLSQEIVHRAPIRYVSFDSEGRRIVTTSDDYTARIWDAWEGNPISPPLKHRGPVLRAEFSGNDHQLLTVGSDETVRLWSVRNGAPLAPALRHSRPVSLASLDPLSQSLLTVSSNRVIQWGLSAEQRAKPVLLREAELLSGRRRDMTGELMGMSSTNLLDSWAILESSHPELFSVNDEQRFDWHAHGFRAAIKRQDVFGSGFHLVAMEAFGDKFANERELLIDQQMQLVSRLAGSEEGKAGVRLVEVGYMSRLGKRLPKRAEGMSARLVDLSHFYNGHLEDSWQLTGNAKNNLEQISAGLNRLGGVDFDVRGVVQLSSRRLDQNSRRQFPKSISGIEIGQTCERVHFLLAAAYPSAEGEIVGTVTFNLSDGKSLERAIAYGVDLSDWWFTREGAERDEGTTIVWSQRTAPNRLIRLFIMTVGLPEGVKGLKSIDLDSGDADSAPFFLGITVD